MKHKEFSIYTRSIRIAFVIIALLTQQSAHPFDLPTYWRASLLQDMPKTNLCTYNTQVSFSYWQANSSHSWNRKKQTSSLLSSDGFSDLSSLAINLEGLQQYEKPKTWEFLRLITKVEDTVIKPEADGIGSFLQMSIREQNRLPNIGLFEFDATLKASYFGVALHQNLAYGFYLHLYGSLQKATLDPIKLHHRGDQPQTVRDKQVFTDFLQNLDEILQENDLMPLLSPFKQTELGDMVASFGWQGYDSQAFGIIRSMQGNVQVGLLIPTDQHHKLDRVFSLPFGYNGQWGITTRSVVQANLLRSIGIGMQSGITIFFDKTQTKRLKTTKQQGFVLTYNSGKTIPYPDQHGWVTLQKGRVIADQGPVWHIAGYLKADHVLGGLSALIGYGIAGQERSNYRVKDKKYLATFCKQVKQADSIMSIVHRDRVASDQHRLSSWHHHTAHCLIQYDFGMHIKSLFATQLAASYHVPLFGRRSWQATICSGQANVQFSWGF